MASALTSASTPTPAAGVAAARLREAMGHFATGVTVITTRAADGRPFGTTANAVSSVSLDPALVLACLRRESETLAALRERRRFAIHVLDHSQSWLAERFARRTQASTWGPVTHDVVGGVPHLPGGLARLHCELHDTADGGDHEIVVGRVVAVELADREDSEPLLFFRGAFHRLARPVTAPAADVEGLTATEVALPSRHGALRILSLSEDPEETSVAILTGRPRGRAGVLVYLHEGCVLGDALGGVCPRRQRLDAALSQMERERLGVAVYHRDARDPFGSCCFAGGTRPAAPSEAAVAAVARATRELGLHEVRVLADAEDARRLAAAGVPVAAHVPPDATVPPRA